MPPVLHDVSRVGHLNLLSRRYLTNPNPMSAPTQVQTTLTMKLVLECVIALHGGGLRHFRHERQLLVIGVLTFAGLFVL